MSTHYCIWCLDNVCISLYYLRNTIEFCTGFQRALHIHWCYLPVRIKIYSLILVCIVTHPMTSWLHVLKFTMPHSTVYGCSGSVSFMKTPRKCGISSCLAYLSSSKFDRGLSGMLIPNTYILRLSDVNWYTYALTRRIK